MIPPKLRKTANFIVKLFSVLGIIALLFAVWFSIRFAKSKTKKQLENYQVYFNEIHANFNKDWAKNAYWDKNKIELSTYKITGLWDEKFYARKTAISVSKELFNDQYNVRTESYERPDLYEVMKVNEFRRQGGDPCPYNLMASLFFLQKNPLILHKMTVSSQDCSGTTFKSYANTKSILKMNYNSYYDQEGVGEKVLPKDILLEDQLIFTLRSLKFREGLDFSTHILESQINNRVGDLLIYKAKIHVFNEEMLSDKSCWKVMVQLDSVKRNIYYFDKVYPNQLVKSIAWDGRTLQLE